MSAKELLKELDRRYQELAVMAANGDLRTHENIEEFVKLVEGRKRVGKPPLF